MKPFHFIFIVFLLACLTGVTGQAFAEIKSLRSAAISNTADAPQLARFIKDKENVDRTFKEQPPVVPHETEKYVINLQENECLDCHTRQPGKDEAKSVEISESHYIDRNGKKHPQPVAARHFCNQCHVPQIDAPPLVESSFRATR